VAGGARGFEIWLVRGNSLFADVGNCPRARTRAHHMARARAARRNTGGLSPLIDPLIGLSERLSLVSSLV
jgi:hypothetical protein